VQRLLIWSNLTKFLSKEVCLMYVCACALHSCAPTTSCHDVIDADVDSECGGCHHEKYVPK